MNTLIKILDSVSGYLKAKTNPNKTSGLYVLFILFLCLIIIYFNWIAILEAIRSNYVAGISKFLILSFLLIILFIFIYNSYRILKNNNNAKIIFFTNILPTALGGFFTYIYISNYYNETFDSSFFFNLILNFFLVFYPLFDTIQSLFKKTNNRIINNVKSFLFIYNLWFFFFLSFTTLLATFWLYFDFWLMWEAIFKSIELFENNYYQFFIGIVQKSLVFFFVILSPIYLLNIHFDFVNHKRKKLFWSIVIILFIIIWKNFNLITVNISEKIVYRSNQILSQNWDNYESHKKAKWFFTEKSYLSLAKGWKLYNNSNFQKLYDSTLEEYFWEKIANFSNNSRSFATNLSKIWKKAEVVLSLWEIENKILSENTLDNSQIDILETTYRFHYTNESKINQEIIMFFETPSKNSVITELKLGLDWEMIWQIAPRWAAKHVYENSLRKNIDPALIEKIGLNTYSLRVFPIPSKTDKKSNWKQLIEIKVISPIQWDKIYYSPKFSFANLKINNDSSFISKVYNDNNLIKEDIKKWDEVNSYINSNHFISLNEANIENKTSFWDICFDPYLHNLINTYPQIFANEKKSLDNKFILFFDNSESVNRNNANKFYSEIFNWFKNYSWVLNDLDIYSYNFEVTKLSDINDIKFWWYSDIDRSVNYIVNNNFKNKNIIFITDDSSFNFWTAENKSRNLEKITSNKISVIKIWEKIKSYKSDFNSIISASDWNIYNLNNKEEIQDIVKSIKENNDTQINTCISSSSENINKIQAWYISNKLLKLINWEDKWYFIAELQNDIASKYKIVNQFNSFIALETENQQKELDVYSQNANKFDSDYNNYWINNNNNFVLWDIVTSWDVITSREHSSNHFIPSPIYSWWRSYDTKLNILIVLKLITYLLEFIWIFIFVAKLIKKDKSQENSIN